MGGDKYYLSDLNEIFEGGGVIRPTDPKKLSEGGTLIFISYVFDVYPVYTN